METSCINTLLMCKARVAKGGHSFLISWAGGNCYLFRRYVTKDSNRTINIEQANILGELFGYHIERHNLYRRIIKYKNEKR